MHKAKAAIAGILALFALAPAVAQQFPTVPDHTVIGRIGVGGQSGPSQAIPFTKLLPNLIGVQLANRVQAGPTSGTAATPTFRALVGADLPAPGASSFGGVQSKTCSTSNWFSSLSTGGVFGCTQPAFSDLTSQIALAQLPTLGANTALGSIAGGTPIALSKTQITTLVNPVTSALPGAIPAFPNTTTTFFRGDGTYSQPACASLSNSNVYCSASQGQLLGTATNDSAAAGFIGEYVTADLVQGSAVSLTTNVTANVTSISLTAGDWDVSAVGGFTGGTTTTVTFADTSVSTTTATEDATDGRIVRFFWNNATVFNSVVPNISLPPTRFSLSSTTTVFLTARAVFATSTATAFGTIRARRVR